MSEYCLRWNNHQPNLVTVFSELLNAESLVDVTLATDGHFIHAHKLVLSACSVYFKDLFGSNPCKHPIVFLKDIKIDDLKTVIDFIYRGEVNVSQERLQDVLKTAESLRIKGLADKPFSYDEYPSQNRPQHLSSSFSSQRSSLTDSREQAQSIDAEDGAEGSGNSPPANKKRKMVSSQDSGDCAQDTNHDGEERQQQQQQHQQHRGGEGGKEDSQKKSSTPGAAAVAVNDDGVNKSPKDKVKEEKEGAHNATSSDARPEYPESRAADAMLLLQGSSSEGGADDGSATPITSTNSRSDSTSGLISPHSQSSLDWPLSLGHWWASVLPALAQHHHHHHTPPHPHPPSSLYLPSRNPRSQVSPVGPSSNVGGSGGGGNNNNNNNNSSGTRPPDAGGGGGGIGGGSHSWGGNGSSSTSREGSPASGGGIGSTGTQLIVGSLDQLALVSALGKEISPQMVQALQSVASRRESFSSAAKLYSVSVTTLWRYYRKLGLSDSTPK